MGLNSLLFLIQEGFQNIRRNGLMSLAALGTVSVALTVLGGSMWMANRVHEMAAAQPQKFNEVDAFLGADVDRPTALAVKARLQALPAVHHVTLVTKEQAWAQFQSEVTDAVENPLPDKFEIEAADVNAVGALSRSLKNAKDFPEIKNVNDANETLRAYIEFARVVRLVGSAVCIGLFVATLFIVQNTIRLTVFARRREIRIMQLVGATSGFIRFPLLLEGVFHGVIGALIASGLVLLTADRLTKLVQSWKSSLVPDVPTQLGPAQVIVGLVCIGAFVGLSGSYLSMRRFLKQV